jgi:hypothetical protein
VDADDFSIVPTLEPGRLELRIVGTIDMTTMSNFAAALEEAHDGAERLELREVCLDVRGMCFFNSASIKNLVKIVLRAQTTGYTVRFLVDGGLPWQARAIEPIRRLGPGTVVIESVLA